LVWGDQVLARLAWLVTVNLPDPIVFQSSRNIFFQKKTKFLQRVR